MTDRSSIRSLAKRARDAALRLSAEEKRAHPLWAGRPPVAARAEAPASVPTYSLYLPEPGAASDTVVVVLPGGGYSGHAEHEAAPIGRWLRSLGITAMVLRYRLAPVYRYPAMLDDAQEAVRLARTNAESWGVTPSRVGILGFSAGGHLAAITATASAETATERPDFAVLIYPVIRMTGEAAHPGCRAALLGDPRETEVARSLNADERVRPGSPPAFIVHGWDDAVVPVENAIAYVTACRSAGVPCELHVFARGPHGFGLARRAGAVAAWPRLCAEWMVRLP
jgi:acetyl esterase/lipase